MFQPYIIVMRNAEFWIVGPFASKEAAGDWGLDQKNNPDDDPRWQVMELERHQALCPTIYGPDEAPRR